MTEILEVPVWGCHSSPSAPYPTKIGMDQVHTIYDRKKRYLSLSRICETPIFAISKKKIDKKNKVKLAIGYRMHHEPNTQTLMNWAETEPYGQINNVLAKAGYFDTRTNHWKQIKELGGGAMYDMGVYPLNAIRYTKGKEPISVSAKHITKRPEIYYEVDETTIFDLKFSDGTIAHGETSLGEHFNNLEATCEEGSYFLKPFQYILQAIL